ncbi:MAG: thiamine-phosphate kinase, partial [Dehalococcoidales bacterium]|nr:thiamine-phosphate kinase [Dehalococcoidales bacterium]
MKVSELGEFGLIDLLAKMVSAQQAQQPPNPRLYIGIGDDAAAWRIPDEIQLATVDTMVQGVHFSTDTVTWKELGWKSLAINVSDIAAMAGVPDYALVALTLPDDTLVEDVSSLYEGMLEIATQFGITIIGGNVSSSPVVSITITVLGSGREDILLRRSTARPGDIVAVTGFPGHAAAGLEVLAKKLYVPEKAVRVFVDAFTHPMPRMIEA